MASSVQILDDGSFRSALFRAAARLVLVGTVVLAAAASLAAQTTWTGAAGNDWHDPSNWSAGVPIASSAVTIPAAVTNAPVVTGTAVCGALFVDLGATLVLNARLTASGNVVAHGAISGSGELALDGMLAISASQPLPNLLITGGVVDANTMTLAGALTVATGELRVVGTCTVQGASVFSGGLVTAAGGAMVCNGDVVWSGSTCSAPPPMTCYGHWTADAGFHPAPTSTAVVTFTGALPQTVDGPFLGGVVVLPGAVVTIASPLALSLDLTVHGTCVGGGLTAFRNVTVSPTGILDLTSAAAVAIGQNVIVTGSLLLGSTTNLHFVGGSASTLIVPPALQLPSITVQKAPGAVLNLPPITIVGDLAVLSGRFVPANATILGTSTFSGGSLEGSGALTLAGDAIWSGTSGSVAAITCLRDWFDDGSFSPTSTSTVTFAGSAPQFVFGADFHRLVVAVGAEVSAPTALSIANDLQVDGSFSGGETSVGADVLVSATGSLSFSGELEVGRNLTVNGTMARGPAASVRFSGATNGAVSIPPGVALPECFVSKAPGGRIVFADTIVGGALTLQSGILRVASTLRIDGVAAFLGGVLESQNAGSDVMTCMDDVYFAGAVAVLPPDIVALADWFADGGFAPGAVGTVTFSGAGPQIVSGPTFPGVAVLGGPVVFVEDTAVNGDLTVQGGLIFADIEVDVAGDLSVAAGASLEWGAGVHALGGDLTIAGQISSGPGAVLVFDRDGTIDVTVALGSVLPNVVIAKATGGVRFGDAWIGGELRLESGVLTALPSALITVDGDARFMGGAVASGGSPLAVLDVAGDVEFNGAAAPSPCSIRCAGNWTADGGFAPTNGASVELDGLLPSTLGPVLPGAALSFGGLAVRNGRRTAATDLSIVATSIAIDAGAELSAGGRRLALPGLAMNVAGTLAAEAEGVLALSPSSNLTVAPTGALKLHGEFGRRAAVEGDGGGGYSLTIDGLLEARNFEFLDMGLGGIVLSAAAVLAAPPFDLRAGRFDRPAAAPGAVLLEIERATPTELRYLEFANSNGATAACVRVLSGAPITFTNWTGSIAGPLFEIDPTNLVTWAAPVSTQVSPLTAIPGFAEIQLSFGTTAEVDVVAFEIERAAAPSGPFSVIAVLTPIGAGSNYSFADAPLVSGQTYDYRLFQILDFGARELLGAAQSTPLAPPAPPGIDVGNGGYATIQDAVDAASSSTTAFIRVASGTYSSFQVGPSAPAQLRIAAVGPGPVIIDTTRGPISIDGLPASSALELAGLTIGSATSPNEALVVSNTAATVVLTDLTIIGGSAHAGLRVDDAKAVVLSRSAASGSPGVQVETGGVLEITRGAVDTLLLTSGAAVTTCGVQPQSIFNDGTATLTTLAGFMPDLLVDRSVSLGTNLDLAMATEPAVFWGLIASLQLAWTDFGSPQFELVCLVDPNVAAILETGLADGFGFDQRSFAVPVFPALIGVNLTMQLVAFGPLAGIYRFSNVAIASVQP